MEILNWLSDNYIEVFGAGTGILYVIFEIRQKIWLWPVGIITSAVYIWVFFTGKLYADMCLQGYYLAISILGWYWWQHGRRERAKYPEEEKENMQKELTVTSVGIKTASVLAGLFSVLFVFMLFILDKLTDSPVPGWDSFITSLSIIATWMLARKLLEHWYLWIIVNLTASILFFTRELYPTMVLYIVYCVMSFAGLAAWKKSLSGMKSRDESRFENK